MGASLLVLAMAGFSLSDALAKQLSAHLPAFSIAWFRYLGLLVTVLPLALRRPSMCRTGQPLLQLLRAAALMGSAVLFLYGLRAIPQAEATAMVFASPLFVLLLTRWVLREHVGVRRFVPVLLGFAGVLIVVRPGTFHFGGAEIFPLLSSAAWASAVVLTRRLGSTDGAGTTMLYSAVLGVAGLSLSLPGIDWPMVRSAWPQIAAMSLGWCAAQWLVILAYRVAPPAAIAPFSYSQLLWAALTGWAMFGHWPDAVSLLGMAVIVASGLYAAWLTRAQAS